MGLGRPAWIAFLTWVGSDSLLVILIAVFVVALWRRWRFLLDCALV